MEGNVIEYFMWGYQQHVQISLQGNAQSSAAENVIFGDNIRVLRDS